MKSAAMGLALVLGIGAASAQTLPEGRPHAGAPVRDAEFGVSSRQFALQRRVAMYQWRKVGGTYVAAWSEQAPDSVGHDAAHRNPETMPLHSQIWRATGATLDGKPLPQDAIDALGVWRDLRPDFSALPGNLAATFQPEGDGLGSAENPLAPRIGDLRITWRERALPSLQERIVLVDGAWVLLPPPASTIVAPPERASPWRAWRWPAVCALALALVSLAWWRRRQNARRREST